jgi:hypothetical protein
MYFRLEMHKSIWRSFRVVTGGTLLMLVALRALAQTPAEQLLNKTPEPAAVAALGVGLLLLSSKPGHR